MLDIYKPQCVLAPTKAFQSLSFRNKRLYSTKKVQQQQTPPEKPPQKCKTSGAILRYETQHSGEYRYALVQGSYTKKWSFPKGHINEEEDPFDCALREVSEETGIDVLPPPATSLQIGFGYYYIFELEEEYPLLPRDTTEVINTKWVTLQEMRKMDVNADVSQYMRMHMR
jgi:8-oxo-dGTP pyrophosphatase MutT (NUDIX family)